MTQAVNCNQIDENGATEFDPDTLTTFKSAHGVYTSIRGTVITKTYALATANPNNALSSTISNITHSRHYFCWDQNVSTTSLFLRRSGTSKHG